MQCEQARSLVQPGLTVVYTSWKLLLFWEIRKKIAGLERMEHKKEMEVGGGQVCEKLPGSSRNHKSMLEQLEQKPEDKGCPGRSQERPTLLTHRLALGH